MAASRKIRYAVVGLGHIAQQAVLPAFQHAGRRSTLGALVSGDPEKLAVLGDEYDVPIRVGYDQYERCLERVDAVYIATPNTEHAEYAVRAARAGVHVLCEKPLATTDEDCQRIAEASREGGVRVMTAYRLHFEPLTIDILERIRDGAIGEPRYFSANFSMMVQPGNIRTRPETGGGSVYDLGVYCINAARMVFEAEPNQVFAYSVDGARDGFPGVDEMTTAVLRFDGDRLASFTSSFGAADVSEYRVVGTKGDIAVEPAFGYSEALAYRWTRDGVTRKKRGRKVDQFAAQIRYFSSCILDGRDPEPSVDEGAWDVRIVDAIYESARRGEPIALRDFGPEPGPEPGQATALPPVGQVRQVNVESPRE